MALTEIADPAYDTEVAASAVPVLLDFGATWCSPCKALKPVLEDVSKTYAGRAKVFYVDTEKAPKTAVKFNVASLPTVIFVKGGKEMGRIVGLRGKGEYTKQLDALLTA